MENIGEAGEEQTSAGKDPLFTGPIEHHDKRTVTESVVVRANRCKIIIFAREHNQSIDRHVDACTCSLTFTSLPATTEGQQEQQRQQQQQEQETRTTRRRRRRRKFVSFHDHRQKETEGWFTREGWSDQKKRKKKRKKENKRRQIRRAEGGWFRRIFTAWHFALSWYFSHLVSRWPTFVRVNSGIKIKKKSVGKGR